MAKCEDLISLVVKGLNYS